jgi:hypothetical protein
MPYNATIGFGPSTTWAATIKGIKNAGDFFYGYLAVTGHSGASSGTEVGALALTPVYTGSGTQGGTDLLINRTETSVGSGPQKLISAGSGGGSYAEKFNVGNTGKGYYADAVAVCSTAARGTEKLFVKGNELISGHLTVDSTTKTGSFLVGDTVMIRTAGAAFAAIKRFQTYADSCAGVDTVNLAALNTSGARARVMTLRDSVFVKDGATVVKILGAAGKWCDVEYLGAPCSRWQVFGSN